MRVKFLTFGCKVNQYESQILRERCRQAGHEVIAGDDCDIVVVNSCCVTARAEKEIRRIVRQWTARGKRVRLTGCYAVRESGRWKGLIPAVEIFSKDDPSPDLFAAGKDGISSFDGHTRAFVKVGDGCDNRCAYCVVPLVRGPAHSRGEREILAEVGRLAGNGYREVVLTGIDLGSYGADTGTDLAVLVKKIAVVRGVERIRLSSLEIFHLSDGLCRVLREIPSFCPHFHLPLQSGSDRILRFMGRRYTAGEYLDVVGRVRGLFPDATFSTDVMVGFPGETGEDFSATISTVRAVRFLKMHIFPYSPREGTRAAGMADVVPLPDVQERECRLLALDHAMKLSVKEGFLGSRQELLIETEQGRLRRGLTRHYLPVVVRSETLPSNSIVTVMLERLSGKEIVGSLSEKRAMKSVGRTT